MRVRYLWAFALSLTTIFMLAGAASAGGARPYCRAAQDADNPMVSSSSFGVATCNARRASRYDADDYVSGPAPLADSSDPMVWSTNQWGSDLFGYTTSYDDRYDRRLHGGSAARHVVRKVVEINVETREVRPSHGFKVATIDGSDVRWTVYKTAPRATPSTPGARVLSGGTVCDNCRRGPVVRPATHCANRGALVITWTAGAAQYRCSTPRRLHRWVN